MFYTQCHRCNKRWELGESRTCTCLDYSNPQPKHEWVGLTDEEVERIKLDGRDLEFVSMTALYRFAQDIQKKLKEKNT